jgi:hypothetical protein
MKRRATGWRGLGAGCARPGEGTMVLRAWMKREQWFIWIVLAILLTLVLAAIGYLAGWWDKLPVSAVLWRWLRTTG